MNFFCFEMNLIVKRSQIIFFQIGIVFLGSLRAEFLYFFVVVSLKKLQFLLTISHLSFMFL